jgi:murein DD-endopeptidase MepM/ murein hydrolase activator NlpD
MRSGVSVLSERITLIIMHSPKAPPKSISIPRGLLVFAAVVVGSLFIFSLFTGLSEISKSIDRARLARLSQENSTLRSELDRLNSKVASLEGDMSEHMVFEERLRIMADLEPLDKDVWEVGIGGPEIGYAPGDHPLGEKVAQMDSEIDKLLRQMKLQRHSFSEIYEELRKKTEDLRYIPSLRPVDGGFISSGFGKRTDPFTKRISRHEGLDFQTRSGAKVYATADGVVTTSTYRRGYGYTVEIDHGNGLLTRYAHNAKNLVRAGERVERGDVIAYVGNSGRSTAPHLHYEVRVNGVAQNPLKYILPSDVIVD